MVEKNKLSFSVICSVLFEIRPSNFISPGILDLDDWPFKFLICFHKKLLSLF